ncbi:MAG: hypothetical protein ABEJ98_02475 [Candidatus Nanohaloarchaea archaeon]
MSRSKGISPIISAVLLVAVSLAVVGVFSGWAPQLIQTLTDSTSNTTQNRINCDRSSISIVSAAYRSGSDSAAVTVRNRGRTDLKNITVLAFRNEVIQGRQAKSLARGSVSTFNITNVNNTPDRINAYSQECGSVTASTEEIS